MPEAQAREATPQVSVVMSTYRDIADGRRANDRDSTLARSIDSVVRQRYPHWELIVVADHPPDELVARIERLIASYGDSRIRFFNLPEKGDVMEPGRLAKLAGLEHARGPLLAFLNSDDAWTVDHLQLSVAALVADPTLDLVYCDSRVRPARNTAPHPLDRLHLPRGIFGPFSGGEFRWSKPDWNDDARALLERINFIDNSEPVLKLDAYYAAGGLKGGHFPYDWRLWQDMVAAGRGNFKHLPHVGLHYFTSSFQQHAGIYMLSQIQKYNLPFDMNDYDRRATLRTRARMEHKHGIAQPHEH